MSYHIVNLVATGDLKQKVRLEDISELEYSIYDQEIYGGRVAYLKTPKMFGKVTIFPSGKLISIGTKSVEMAQTDLEITEKTLTSAGLIQPKQITANVRNIVILLQQPALALEDFAEFIGGIYEPEQFPGIIYKPDDIDTTYLIFASGKIILSGIKSIEQIPVAINKILTINKEFGI